MIKLARRIEIKKNIELMVAKFDSLPPTGNHTDWDPGGNTHALLTWHGSLVHLL